MLQSTPLKSLSTAQRIAVGIVLVVALMLVIGSLLPGSGGQAAFGVQTQSFLVLAILSFFGGVLSFVSPCTLPILPAYFAFAFQSGRKQIAANTLAFMLGLGTMFSLLGAGASVIGRVLQQNADLLLLVGGSAIVIFGVMSLLGKGFSGLAQEEGDGGRSTTLGGSYAFGLTFAVGWTSCVGPILGVVLTLAATTGSVVRGIMLLFIYTMGLGLPLLLVSTLFGRASRQSLFWRVLRGKGWRVKAPIVAVGVLWALAIWRILVAVGNFALSDFHTLTARPLAPWQEYGLLAVALVGVFLWIMTGKEERRVTLQLHSTQLISGALFILLGLFMLSGLLTYFNSLIPPDLAIWFADFEEALIGFFS